MVRQPPAVAWMYKFRTSTSLVAAPILRALAVRLHTNQAASLSVKHISGIYNTMADVASRRHSLDNAKFLTDFFALFPPPQDESWTLFLLSNKVTSKVCSELLNQQSTLESWRRLPTKEYIFGRLGQTSSPPIFQHIQSRAREIEKGLSLLAVLSRVFTPVFFTDE
jgi:hypothetical protein